MPGIERGEIWLVDLGLAAKARPAVVFNILTRSERGAFNRRCMRTGPLTVSMEAMTRLLFSQTPGE